MRIAIYGTGPIGSTFGFHLSRACHDVTCIARGPRLEQLRVDGAIVLEDGRRAAGTLDPEVPLREAVGPARFAFGFPAILATLKDGRLSATIVSRGQTSITTDASWADVFTEAGVRTTVEPDMQSWLRTHAVLIATMNAMAVVAHERHAGVRWKEAKAYVRALREGFTVVERLGDRVVPGAMRLLRAAPDVVLTALWWGLSRTRLLQDEIGALGPGEARALTDEMLAAAPEGTPALRAVRPA